MRISADYIKKSIDNELTKMGAKPDDSSNRQLYEALAATVNSILADKALRFKAKNASEGRKQISYLSMEFLMGRSLKNNLFNLSITDKAASVISHYDAKLEDLYECEPDAGLGNGGLGRLAACYLDGLATVGYNSYGYSILYEFGIFKQKIVEGWQTELPDNWLPGGDVWLNPEPGQAIDVHFGGYIDEYWDQGYHFVVQKNHSVVKAVPYDLYVSGYNSQGVAVLRLWKAEGVAFDMDSFNRGDYTGALGQSINAEAISKVLYPNDNHVQGKELRLRQQYFLCSASINDIVNRHLREYGTLDDFAEKNAIHINDTHPTLAIPELMRLLLDECGYSWDKSWEIVTRTFNYTNHTVMKEALEIWDEGMFKEILPRIYQITVEINKRFVAEMEQQFGWDRMRIDRMAIICDHEVRMAYLCIYASNRVNGVSELHSDIIKEDVFNEFYQMWPEKFTNVTNGIAHRRWLTQSNPALAEVLRSTIGDTFAKDASSLQLLKKYAGQKTLHKKLESAKLKAKQSFADYILKKQGVKIDINTIFDVQVKRMHEYKRQHLNAMNIIDDYLYLLDNPNDENFAPKTYIFGAKAAPGYYMAKQIIKLLCTLAEEIKKNPEINKKLNVVYIENYSVTMAEHVIPAADVSEQISLAGTEASGTGNMKFMINGAITLGTLDGANVEIRELVGDENIIVFGMNTQEVQDKKKHYNPGDYYNNNPHIKRAIDFIAHGIEGSSFDDIANSLKNDDPFMVLADFESYREAQAKVSELYLDRDRWYTMAAMNIANAGYFSADRSVTDYADYIWNLKD